MFRALLILFLAGFLASFTALRNLATAFCDTFQRLVQVAASKITTSLAVTLLGPSDRNPASRHSPRATTVPTRRTAMHDDDLSEDCPPVYAASIDDALTKSSPLSASLQHHPLPAVQELGFPTSRRTGRVRLIATFSGLDEGARVVRNRLASVASEAPSQFVASITRSDGGLPPPYASPQRLARAHASSAPRRLYLLNRFPSQYSSQQHLRRVRSATAPPRSHATCDIRSRQEQPRYERAASDSGLGRARPSYSSDNIPTEHPPAYSSLQPQQKKCDVPALQRGHGTLKQLQFLDVAGAV